MTPAPPPATGFADRADLSTLLPTIQGNAAIATSGDGKAEAVCYQRRLSGNGWGRLLAPVPVTQRGEQNNGRHAGQSTGDKEDAVSVNEAVRAAQTLHRCAGKPFKDLSEPGIG